MNQRDGADSGGREGDRALRLVVLASHPIQYFVPVYRELNKQHGIDLTVLYRTRVGVESYQDPGFDIQLQWDIPLLGGYKHRFLSRKTTLGGFEPTMFSALLRHRPDVLLVHGYSSLTNILAILWAKILGVKVLMRGDTRWTARHRANGIKAQVKRLLFQMIDGFVSIGSLNRAYYLAFGVTTDRIFFAPFCVDNQVFGLQDEVQRAERRQVRRTLGLPENCIVVLFASKLMPVKRPQDLVQAFQRVHQRFPDAWLVMAGSGVLEKPVRHEVEKMMLPRVRFLGFQNQSALPGLYAASDIFVLPSSGDQWGLVVNEAMAAGLPVIISDEVGAAPDLVQEKGSGIVYRCGDVEALATALETLLQSEAVRKQMGTMARRVIRDWDVSACAAGIAVAAKSVFQSVAASPDSFQSASPGNGSFGKKGKHSRH